MNRFRGTLIAAVLMLIGLTTCGWLSAQEPATPRPRAENPDLITVKREFITMEVPSPNYLSSVFGSEIIIQSTDEAGKVVIYQTEKSKYDRRYATSAMGRQEQGLITEDHLCFRI